MLMNMTQKVVCWWKVRKFKQVWAGDGKEVLLKEFGFDDPSMVVHHYLNVNPPFGGNVGYRGLKFTDPLICNEFMKSYEHYQYSFKALWKVATQATVTPLLYLNGDCLDIWLSLIDALNTNNTLALLKFFKEVDQTCTNLIGHGNYHYIWPSKNAGTDLQYGHVGVDQLHMRMDVINLQMLIKDIKNAAISNLQALENFQLSPECIANIHKVNFKLSKNYNILMRIFDDECKLFIRREGTCLDFEWLVKQLKSDTLYYRKTGLLGYFKINKF